MNTYSFRKWYFKTTKNNANSIKDEYKKTIPEKNGIQRISEKVISGNNYSALELHGRAR